METPTRSQGKPTPGLQQDNLGMVLSTEPQLGNFMTEFALPGERTQPCHAPSWHLPIQKQVFSFNVTVIIILILQLF